MRSRSGITSLILTLAVPFAAPFVGASCSSSANHAGPTSAGPPITAAVGAPSTAAGPVGAPSTAAVGPTASSPTGATSPTTAVATPSTAVVTVEPGPPETPTGETPPGETQAPDTQAPGTGSTSESPLDPYVGGNWSQSFDADEYARQNDHKEELIAACMKEQGFDYIPYTPDYQFVPMAGGAALGTISSGGSALGEGLSDEEFAKRYGYGISTDDRPPEERQSIDPNGAIVDALSVSGRVAYHRALYGPDVSLQDDGRLAREELPHDDSSCWRQAANEAFGSAEPVDTSILDAFRPLLDEMDSLYGRLLADSRIVAAVQTWSECLAGKGHPGYTDLNRPRQDVSERATALLGEARDPNAADPDLLAELRAFEISIATTDLECRQPYDETYVAVEFEIQSAFVEANRAQLEQYRDAVAAAGAGG